MTRGEELSDKTTEEGKRNCNQAGQMGRFQNPVGVLSRTIIRERAKVRKKEATLGRRLSESFANRPIAFVTPSLAELRRFIAQRSIAGGHNGGARPSRG